MNYHEIKTLKEQVKYFLNDYIDCRNNDAFLIEKISNYYGYNPIEKASSIERCRRWWQSKGKYLPTDERIARTRKMNMDEWRVAMGYPTKESESTPNPSWIPPSEIKKSVGESEPPKQKSLL